MAKKSTPKSEDVKVISERVIQHAFAVVRFLRHQSLDHFAETVENLISAVERGKSK